jgi:hypothetical protein
MFDGNRIAERLDETELPIEEFYFLYRIMCQEQNISSGILKSPGKKESDEAGIRFSQLSEKYQQRFKTILNSGKDWIVVANELADKGFLEIWKQTSTEIKLTDMRVTDLFKSYFLISDINKAYIEVLEIWPPWLWANNVKYSAIDKSPDEMAKIYDQHILKGGSLILHERFLMITKMYLETLQKKGAPYKLSNWIINIFENVAIAMEQGEEPTLTSQEI